MPWSAPRPCSVYGCSGRVVGKARRCPQHEADFKREDTERHRVKYGAPSERGYDHDWHVLRDRFMELNPSCACGKPSRIVHHIEHVRANPARRLDPSNLIALCWSCHERTHKRVTHSKEDGEA